MRAVRCARGVGISSVKAVIVVVSRVGVGGPWRSEGLEVVLILVGGGCSSGAVLKLLLILLLLGVFGVFDFLVFIYHMLVFMISLVFPFLEFKGQFSDFQSPTGFLGSFKKVGFNGAWIMLGTRILWVVGDGGDDAVWKQNAVSVTELLEASTAFALVFIIAMRAVVLHTVVETSSSASAGRASPVC
jgi:hypothetical protein